MGNAEVDDREHHRLLRNRTQRTGSFVGKKGRSRRRGWRCSTRATVHPLLGMALPAFPSLSCLPPSSTLHQRCCCGVAEGRDKVPAIRKGRDLSHPQEVLCCEVGWQWVRSEDRAERQKIRQDHCCLVTYSLLVLGIKPRASCVLDK